MAIDPQRLIHSHSIVSGTHKRLTILDFLLACNEFTVKYTVN
jgi:hypothetical protein